MSSSVEKLTPEEVDELLIGGHEDGPGCYDCTPVRAAHTIRAFEAENARLRHSLENCRMLAARRARRPNPTPGSPGDWSDILRFCREAGVEGSILRNES